MKTLETFLTSFSSGDLIAIAITIILLYVLTQFYHLLFQTDQDNIDFIKAYYDQKIENTKNYIKENKTTITITHHRNLLDKIDLLDAERSYYIKYPALFKKR